MRSLLMQFKTPKIITIEKIIPDNIPIFRSFPAHSETNPTIVGPKLHPRSPARARIANITVLPPLISFAARLYVPGHITPTDHPHIAHPTRDKKGSGESEMIR